MRTIGIQIALACLMMTVLDSAGCQAGDYPTREDCDQDHDGFLANTPECMHGMDCDDSDPLISPAAKEGCDGKDNDCNGQTDENCCIVDEPCDPTPGPIPKRICMPGTRKCQRDGSLSPDCLGAVLASEEICDNMDNDCDSETDEGYYYHPLEGGTLKIGDICSVGIGACKYSSNVWCSDSRTADCKKMTPEPKASPNEPQFMPAKNGSWDWNCDGAITQKCCIQDSKVDCSYDSDCHPNISHSTDNLTICRDNCNWYLSGCRGLTSDRDIYLRPLILSSTFCGETMIEICQCHLHVSGCDAAYIGTVKGQMGCY